MFSKQTIAGVLCALAISGFVRWQFGTNLGA